MTKCILILIIIIVAVIGGGAIAYITLRQGGEEIREKQEIATITEEPGVQPEEPTTTEPTDISDCESDLDCLIKASKNCDKAKVIDTKTTEMFGMLLTTTTFLEIKGMEENKCALYLRIEKQDVHFSDEMVQKMLDGGTTQEQIEQQEQEANKQADIVEGKDGICKFKSSNDLTAFLSKWKEGNLSGSVSCKLVDDSWECTSTGDWAVAECEGEIFGQQFR